MTSLKPASSSRGRGSGQQPVADQADGAWPRAGWCERVGSRPCVARRSTPALLARPGSATSRTSRRTTRRPQGAATANAFSSRSMSRWSTSSRWRICHPRRCASPTWTTSPSAEDIAEVEQRQQPAAPGRTAAPTIRGSVVIEARDARHGHGPSSSFLELRSTADLERAEFGDVATAHHREESVGEDAEPSRAQWDRMDVVDPGDEARPAGHGHAGRRLWRCRRRALAWRPRRCCDSRRHRIARSDRASVRAWRSAC